MADAAGHIGLDKHLIACHPQQIRRALVACIAPDRAPCKTRKVAGIEHLLRGQPRRTSGAAAAHRIGGKFFVPVALADAAVAVPPRQRARGVIASPLCRGAARGIALADAAAGEVIYPHQRARVVGVAILGRGAARGIALEDAAAVPSHQRARVVGVAIFGRGAARGIALADADAAAAAEVVPPHQRARGVGVAPLCRGAACGIALADVAAVVFPHQRSRGVAGAPLCRGVARGIALEDSAAVPPRQRARGVPAPPRCLDAGIVQAHMGNARSAAGSTKQARIAGAEARVAGVLRLSHIDRQIADAVAQAVEAAGKARGVGVVAVAANGHKAVVDAGIQVPAGGGAGIDMVDQCIAACQIVLYGLQLLHILNGGVQRRAAGMADAAGHIGLDKYLIACHPQQIRRALVACIAPDRAPCKTRKVAGIEHLLRGQPRRTSGAADAHRTGSQVFVPVALADAAVVHPRQRTCGVPVPPLCRGAACGIALADAAEDVHPHQRARGVVVAPFSRCGGVARGIALADVAVEVLPHQRARGVFVVASRPPCRGAARGIALADVAADVHPHQRARGVLVVASPPSAVALPVA